MEQGTMIDNRYQIVRPLGDGGMANVFQAYDTYLKRDVTLKMIRFDIKDQPEALARFQKEAKAATTLVNDHIVQLYDAGEAEGNPYLVMEYVAGMDLKSYIKAHFPIPYQEVVDIMEQVLEAVSAAHKAGIIHRDLKPQNILINEQGQVKITDFGIALAQNKFGLPATKEPIIGSIHYLAPEVTRGQQASEKSDIYALGVILYEMLTNQVPYQGDTADRIAYQHAEVPMPYVKDFDPEIPQPLENVILRATAKDGKDRYFTTEDMAEDLQTSLSKRRSGEGRFVPEASDETKLVTPDWNSHPFVEDDPEESATEEKNDVESRIIDYGQKGYAVKEIAEQVDRTPKFVREVLDKNGIKYRSKKKWFVLAFFLLVIAGATASFTIAKNSYTAVPDVTNLSESAAKSKLSDAGLSVGTTAMASSKSVSKGDVIKVVPGVGRSVKKSSSVKLVISSGTDTVSISDYSGWDYSKAANQLTNKGITVKKKTENSTSVPSGQVMSQSIAAGSDVDPSDTTITLTVSDGAKSLTLPDLTGKSQSDAVNWANQNQVSLAFTITDSNKPSGTVIAQDPAAGSKFTLDKTLTLQVSSGASAASSSSQSDNGNKNN
ncbi:Stk1 family PASTA domain-containing Ser/Thr kinase [Fructobacillus sp. M1-13]|uniref:non-specific serine/threonine protein kinase n=1 Tax=Fructobacillus papyriferae TaxID=2713171 RepID=A0ABS5QNY4_9LACO|nr:Stk1 family PASTA domain-containing Ser/Thr kinase [Fructobacillus papyriferae]MBS9334487.1 Stk1 family PASTA domain-containing Ser/Thr kinase [Fructobacillus papyriferae]MCD2158476.1 Stk1 family PASTA domain-containing Ser/Thr kinase [Fructobacillus papyriferae]